MRIDNACLHGCSFSFSTNGYLIGGPHPPTTTAKIPTQRSNQRGQRIGFIYSKALTSTQQKKKTEMATTSFTAPKLSSPTLQTLYRNLPVSVPLPKTLSSFSRYLPPSASGFHHYHRLQRRRLFSFRAESDNGAEPLRHYDFDLFTIGAGSGGVRASRFAANFGASVAVCELPFSTISSETTGGVGGTCVLRGCVPKKLMVYASKYSHEFDESNGFGWKYDTEPKHDWSTLMANKNAELQRLTGIYKNILNNAGVTLIEGRGKIVDPHTVDVDGKLYTARHILISVGGRPFIPEIPGSEYVIDSDAALDLPSKPEKVAIVGGGYIALEFAGIFNGLKSEVHVFIRQKKVLRGFDEEIRDFVGEQMSLRGIEFHTEESPQAVVKSAVGSLSLKTNKGTVEGFSHIMFATGRRPNTKNLGLESVGVKMNKNGAIEVDEYSRTTVPSIWAVGDVTDRINLTPVSLMEGGALAKTLFQNQPTKPDYSRAVPSAVFSQPPIGQVGLTEEQAIKEYGDLDVYTANFRPLKATLSGLPDRVFMKLIVCAKTNKVLGLHMCGEDSAEIVQGFAVAVKAGLTKTDFDATVGIHPTSAEEFVTMRTPTRKIRQSPESEGKTGFESKAAAGV
ncbi:glutathione reductase, chloroplastic-like isoform X2 [Durio zibethinus]|uniref:Glutathione reductase n=1 Tax=Durio zibethinus TaxID=66656 RepID=A0A6P6A0T2_DURZI|nr:glutathione reductase, chloroplastic-like isoform X2 [Durio zibethinus]